METNLNNMEYKVLHKYTQKKFIEAILWISGWSLPILFFVYITVSVILGGDTLSAILLTIMELGLSTLIFIMCIKPFIAQLGMYNKVKNNQYEVYRETINLKQIKREWPYGDEGNSVDYCFVTTPSFENLEVYSINTNESWENMHEGDQACIVSILNSKHTFCICAD